MDYSDEWTTPTTTINTSLTHLSSWLLHSPLYPHWTPFHHLYFQIANFSLFVLFLSNNNTLRRVVAINYSVFMTLWGYFVLRSVDLIAWNLVFLFVNLSVVVVGAFRFCCRQRFGGDLEQVYRKLFEPLHISRAQFTRILSCKRNTRQLHPSEHYATEKTTRVDSLSLLISGKLLVSQQNRPLHMIQQFQFVDSPEYFGVSTDELFQVTITAVEESKVLVWHRDKLRLTILADDYLREMFDHIIGRDVVRKLIQVSDSVSITSGYYMNCNKEETEPLVDFDSGKMVECAKVF